MSQTLALIKPNVTNKNLIGKVITRIEDSKFKIVALRMVNFTDEICNEFYAEHKGKSFFNELVSSMQEGPVVALVLETEGDAISKWRQLIGSTNPAESAVGTIRYDYAESMTYNAAHGSDSEASFMREKGILFPNL